MNKINKLTIKEREEIFRLSAQGLSGREIAKQLGRNQSSISRELRRKEMNQKTYSVAEAQVDRNSKAVLKGRKKKIIPRTKLFDRIHHLLLEKRWSPEQISQYLKKESKVNRWNVSHETIYQYIYSMEEREERKKWISSLRQKRKKRRLKRASKSVVGKIPNRVSIHDRPGHVKDRIEVGHWEGDLIIGKEGASAIGTIVERVSRFTLIVDLKDGRTSDKVVQAFHEALEWIPAFLKKSFTYDNGTEMAQHNVLKDLTGMDIYFADPASPYQRGTNENTNGLIRDFFPKKTDFRNVREDELQNVQNLLNQRPRKILGYETPEDVFERHMKGSDPPVTKHRLRNGELSSGDLVL